LTTKQVASALGVSYEVLTKVMGPLRKALPVQKEGAYLLWSADAVRMVREALDRRRAQQEIGEAQDYDGAVRSIGTLAVNLRKLATDLEKLRELLSRKPAETGFLHTIPVSTHALRTPVRVLLVPLSGQGFQASLAELSLTTEGRTRQEALRLLRQRLWNWYREVSASPDSSPAEWTALQQLIVPR
jgi:hypothetical protein